MITDKQYKRICYISIFLVFIIYFVSSCLLRTECAPDEYMRYDIPLYIFNHGHLPVGDEAEVINSMWGFSYGFSPYLPSLISVIFMKITSIFTTDTNALLISSRFVSVLAGTGVFYMCFKIGEQLFKRKTSIILFAVLCGFLPQFVFLSSYLNNDSSSVFATALILYFWIKGVRDNWSYKTCVFLGVALGICALTYYNAYGFILCSVFVYCISSWKLKNKFSVFIKKGLVIFAFAMIVGGWFFIRNAIIHDGDFLGMNAMYECGEKFAAPEYRLSSRGNPANQGFSFKQTFLSPINGMSWVASTATSFIAVFGYMNVRVPDIIYLFYGFIILFGGLFFILACLKKRKAMVFMDNLIIGNLMLCIVIPILLSMYYSYFVDYQAQGRYIMSSLIPVMLFVTIGFDYVQSILEKRGQLGKYFNICIIVLLIVSFLYVYVEVLAKNCFA